MKHKHAEFIKAWADGECVQAKDVYGDWATVRSLDVFNHDYEFRIKPKTQTYRVALLAKPDGNGFVAIAVNSQEQEEDFFSSQRFVRWLTDRIEYEV
jgi:hypothetical protein